MNFKNVQEMGELKKAADRNEDLSSGSVTVPPGPPQLELDCSGDEDESNDRH